jgi:hypothetical protein
MIGDLIASKDLKLSGRGQREDWALARDAVHGELLKALRAIDVMHTAAASALAHTPPRSDAEALRRRRELERHAERSAMNARLIANSSVSSSRSRGRSGAADSGSDSQSPGRSGRQRLVATAGLDGTAVAGDRSVAFTLPSSIGQASNNASESSMVAAAAGERPEKSPQRDLAGDTDPRVAFEAIATSQGQLVDALGILRKPPSVAPVSSAVDERSPRMRVISTSPARTFFHPHEGEPRLPYV